jgi:hypothetical protein
LVHIQARRRVSATGFRSCEPTLTSQRYSPAGSMGSSAVSQSGFASGASPAVGPFPFNSFSANYLLTTTLLVQRTECFAMRQK